MLHWVCVIAKRQLETLLSLVCECVRECVCVHESVRCLICANCVTAVDHGQTLGQTTGRATHGRGEGM